MLFAKAPAELTTLMWEEVGPNSFDEVYIHNVRRNQEESVRAYGERAIPKLRWPGR